MAHLVDGLLSGPVLLGGAAIAAAGLALGLRRVDGDRLPYCGLLSATFFVASLIHIPVGPSNVHLLLNGLLGLVLGWAAVPAIFTGLLLQALFFGFGGITVLGVNTAVMALPAVACFYLFGRGARRGGRLAWAWAAAAGASSVLLTCAGVSAALALSGDEFRTAAWLVLVAHLPVLAVEAFVTASIVGFLHRVRPDVMLLATKLDGRLDHA